MNLEKLLENETLSKTKPDGDAARNSLQLAQRDLKTADKILSEEEYDWTLTVSYNAMLQAGRALMFFKGYRAATSFKHLAVARFLSTFDQELDKDLVTLFDKIRKRRHVVVYDFAGTVSKTEAENALKKARKLVEKVRELIESRKSDSLLSRKGHNKSSLSKKQEKKKRKSVFDIKSIPKDKAKSNWSERVDELLHGWKKENQ